MHASGSEIPGFRFSIERKGIGRFKLSASQVVPVGRVEAFRFFEDPRNLSHIIPEWVNFRFENDGRAAVVRKNAEFDYSLTWLGIPLHWRSRITVYDPPERFTDIQVKGPYSSWEHTHLLEETPGGTLMEDKVFYKIPLIAVPVHGFIITRQLEEIFRYRAGKIAEWVVSIR
jgi:ligand-binding SRPBCC domain-containing protein